VKRDFKNHLKSLFLFLDNAFWQKHTTDIVHSRSRIRAYLNFRLQ